MSVRKNTQCDEKERAEVTLRHDLGSRARVLPHDLKEKRWDPSVSSSKSREIAFLVSQIESQEAAARSELEAILRSRSEVRSRILQIKSTSSPYLFPNEHVLNLEKDIRRLDREHREVTVRHKKQRQDLEARLFHLLDDQAHLEF
ncbi:MAG: hypothetical protein A49_11820 [Methyloceanibacter sp.]|nr:MAG: hypothetical protein A49_11820 [Methyloceanibacter sp.]